MNLFSTTITVVAAIAGLATAVGKITLPEIYADHMVIQTDQPIALSGSSSSGSKPLEIKLAGQSVTVNPGLFGGWTATLDPVSEVGGSHTLTISVEGEVEHTIEDITFGDVWLCGGQSNMAFDMTTINDSAAEIASADYPDIRLMEVALRTATKPSKELSQIDQVWTPCSPSAVRQFSAVGFLFGREIHEETGRPIGLVQSAWGGSRIETWIPDTALQESPYAAGVSSRTFGVAHHRPSICYNAMIHGLAPLAFKGVIWYQGESNQTHPEEYRSLHETLISSWRDLWQSPELPFYYVQLANYRPGIRWEFLREAQTQVLAIPHTGMAVTIDIGNSSDIHPRNKQGTAHRLAAIALAETYDQEQVYSGPLFRSAQRVGSEIILEFDHVGTGLVGLDGDTALEGFEVLAASGNWAKANAKIVGDQVVLPGNIFRPDPQGVRYGWASDPNVSLSNKEGFPASPFRFEAHELTYASWKDQLVGSERAPNEDANGDGVSNFMRYASADRSPQIVAQEDGSYEISLHQRAGASDTAVVLEESHDLTTWTETWSSEEPESTLSWSEEKQWGTVLTNRYRLIVPETAQVGSYYRVRYLLK